MPTYFPALGPDGDDLIQVRHWNVTEAAPMVHVTRATLRERLESGRWPGLKSGSHWYVSAADIARIVELMRNGADDVDDTPPQLGTILDDRDDEDGVQ